MYYVRNLLPMPESGLKAMLAVLDKDPPSTATAIGILLVIGAIFAFAGYYVFRKKQFTIKSA